MLRPSIQEKLDTLPPSPGVYVFRDASGGVLYVGKARSLRARVRSYFQPGTSDVRAFIARLETELEDIETYVTATEKEAALLENQLIKREQPRYNVKLRDDKTYLSLRLDPNAEWPRLEVVRKTRSDGALYFGPYDSASSARKTLRLVNRHFKLRTCSDAELKRRTRPCLQYQIGRCPAPCVYPVDREAYGEQVRAVALFLDGRHDELVAALEAKMRDAAEALRYEEAATYRDQLRAVERVRERQRVETVSELDQDVLGLHRAADQAQIAVLQVRAGKLVSVRSFPLRNVAAPDDEVVASFVAQAYGEQTLRVPDEVLLPCDVEAIDGLTDALNEARATRARVLVPKRGPKARLVAMANANAAHAFNEQRRAQEDVAARLARVQARLRLPRLPRRIECIDISHTGGEDTVAAIVALEDGVPDRARYRGFRIRTVQGGDDYGAMYEALSRRFRRGREGQAGWELPDLLVVDGGKGQLRVAREALRALGVEDVPIAALAKERENVLGETLVDRVYLPDQKNPVALRSNPALAMLALARDEAHRSSNRLRKSRGKRRRLASELDEVEGVGPKTRARLLHALREAGVVEQEPAAPLSLAAPEDGAELGGEELLRAALAELRARDPIAYSARFGELAYLANVLVSGYQRGTRRLPPAQAAKLALRVVARGVAQRLGSARLDALEATVRLLRREHADRLFRIGWPLHLDDEGQHPIA